MIQISKWFRIGRKRDGGPKSHVTGLFLEHKKIGTLALLRFAPGTREAYHTHAFNCWSIILGPGFLEEIFFDGKRRFHYPGDFLATYKEDNHKVFSHGTTFVLTVRGPWQDQWTEDIGDKHVVLTHDRKVVK